MLNPLSLSSSFLSPLFPLARDLGLHLFGSLVMSQGRTRERVVEGILALIHRERSVVLNESILHFHFRASFTVGVLASSTFH